MPSTDYEPTPWRLGRAAAVLSMAAMIAACAPVPPAPPPPPTVVYVPVPYPQDQATQHLLSYHATVSQMNAADLTREISRLGDGASSPEATMELALALGFTHTNGDLVRAQGLLDKVLADHTEAAQSWHDLARLLSARYADQRRAEEQIERLNQQLRDTQRDNQRKLDQLNEKLEALKSIERSLNSRPPATPAPPPTPQPAPQASAAKTPPKP